jgi:hypothetical protein
MSNLIHCDGPDCDQALNPDDPTDDRLCVGPWIQVGQAGHPRLDFCSQACLAAWSSDRPRAGGTAQLDGQPCTCHRAQADPHTKAEHQAYPTVDGL